MVTISRKIVLAVENEYQNIVTKYIQELPFKRSTSAFHFFFNVNNHFNSLKLKINIIMSHFHVFGSVSCCCKCVCESIIKIYTLTER